MTSIASLRARGFTLIEALVALLVLSFGMLAVAAFQVTLARSTDVAKQRSEATRLAQQQMERLRAYGQTAAHAGSPHIFNYTDDLVSSVAPHDQIDGSNARFTRRWTVTANAADTEKLINVIVEWTDRAGQTQSVQLLSVISKFDPKTIGTLATGGGLPVQRRPKNRNINIPYPAVTLSGGTRSAFMPPPGNIAYVFDNQTGNIVQSCTGLTTSATPPAPVTIQSLASNGTEVTVSASGHSFVSGNTITIAGTTDAAFHGNFVITGTSPGASFTFESTIANGTSATGGTATQVVTQLVEGLDLATAAGVSCIDIDAYLLSGYVRFDTSNNPTGEEPGNPGGSNETKPLDATAPFTLTTSNNPSPNLGGAPSMTCYSQRQKTVTTNPTVYTISSVSMSGDTVTVNASGHAFVVGNTVAINGVSAPSFSGAYVVKTVNPGVSFTYTMPPPLPTATSGTGGTVQLVQRLTVSESTTIAGYSTVTAKFVSYACIMTPVDHDNNLSTPKRWWGKLTLNPNSSSSVGEVWQVGTGSGQFKVCRFSADWNSDLKISNSEHPLWYRGVVGALDSQNFLVIDRNQSCPTDRAQDYLSTPPNFADNTTAGHQPSSIEVSSFQCLTASCNGSNKANREATPNTADIPMD